jgi:hypothetical protein
MTGTRKPLWLLLGATAVLTGLTCAPVDLPPETEPVSSKEPGTAETISEVPPAQPQGLRERVESAVEQVRKRDLLTTNGFWTVFHGILGLGPSVTLLNPETGQRVNALDYICAGNPVRGLRFIPTKDGLDVETGVQMFVSQGHQDQFVAEMAQHAVPADRKFVVDGRDYTFMDFVRHTKQRARVTANQELSWAILVLGQYLGTDLEWTNSAGEKLRFEDLVRYEVNQPVEEAACGGTHRLFGLSWVYHLHLRKGGQTTGVWKDLAAHVEKYQKTARQLQNPDGSFSTSFFRGPGRATDMQLRINTTGHTLEWLALSLPDQELRAPWVENAVNALTLMILEIQGQPMEGGTLYHAVHGLLIYYSRVFGPEKLGPLAPEVSLPPK